MSRKRRRDPQREQFWREAIAAREKCGQSVRAFCAGRQLSEASFYGWRRTLQERDRLRPTERPVPTFVPLRVVPEAVVEVVLPAGLVVRVPRGAEAAAVAALIAALRAATC
jgi:transposase-like protein